MGHEHEIFQGCIPAHSLECTEFHTPWGCPRRGLSQPLRSPADIPTALPRGCQVRAALAPAAHPGSQMGRFGVCTERTKAGGRDALQCVPVGLGAGPLLPRHSTCERAVWRHRGGPPPARQLAQEAPPGPGMLQKAMPHRPIGIHRVVFLADSHERCHQMRSTPARCFWPLGEVATGVFVLAAIQCGLRVGARMSLIADGASV